MLGVGEYPLFKTLWLYGWLALAFIGASLVSASGFVSIFYFHVDFNHLRCFRLEFTRNVICAHGLVLLAGTIVAFPEIGWAFSCCVPSVNRALCVFCRCTRLVSCMLAMFVFCVHQSLVCVSSLISSVYQVRSHIVFVWYNQSLHAWLHWVVSSTSRVFPVLNCQVRMYRLV